MVKKNYTTEVEGKNVVRGMIKNQDISRKYSVEMARQVKGMYLNDADAYLDRVLAHEDFLPLLWYRKKTPHRKGASKEGVKSGRYPKKVSIAFKKLIENLKGNAEDKGFNVKKMRIISAVASGGFRRYKAMKMPGKTAGVKTKSTHVEMIAREAGN